MQVNAAVERVLRRDRVIVLAGLAGVIAIAWLYLVLQAQAMNAMPSPREAEPMAGMDMAMPGMESGPNAASPVAWTPADGLLTFLMWSVMMVAMMTPSAAPMILLYARVVRKRGGAGLPYAPTTAFFAGYLAVWFAFSAGATILQWALAQSSLLSPMWVSLNPVLTAALLVAAGVYQFAPAKRACLNQCRSPVEFLSRHWRSGATGAFRMGVIHGRTCLGCCGVIMLLLFVGGVMNLAWVAAIAALVLLEKATPAGKLLGQAGGVALIAAGFAAIILG